MDEDEFDDVVEPGGAVGDGKTVLKVKNKLCYCSKAVELLTEGQAALLNQVEALKREIDELKH